MGQVISTTKTSGWDNIWDGIASGLGGYAKGAAVRNMYAGERGLMNPGAVSPSALSISPVAEVVKANASFVPQTSAGIPATTSLRQAVPPVAQQAGRPFGGNTGNAPAPVDPTEPFWSMLGSGLNALGQAGVNTLGNLLAPRRP